MQLLSGKQVGALCQHFSPFDRSGELRPESERVTLLAANLFPPIDVMSRGFVMAAAQGEQSPLLIQISYSAANMTGGNPQAVAPPEGVVPRASNHIVAGGSLVRAVVGRLAGQYGARFVGITLDHFRAPPFGMVMSKSHPGVSSLDRSVLQARLDDAAAAADGVPGGAYAGVSHEDCVRYMASEEYRTFKKTFLSVVGAISPAWGMVDTETLPPALVFAVTRDIADDLKNALGNDDMILEAEFGITGTSGDDSEYERLTGDALREYAKAMAAFVSYSGAGAIAYPIGMVHASPIGERHEPDVERLLAVHREVIQRTGRYVPFAQHGGTGAKYLARGLVGKDNIATRFMVTAMNFMADYVNDNIGGIREGRKSACNPGVYNRMSLAVAMAVIEKLKECGVYGKGPEAAALLGCDESPALPAPIVDPVGTKPDSLE